MVDKEILIVKIVNDMAINVGSTVRLKAILLQKVKKTQNLLENCKIMTKFEAKFSII